MEEKECVELKNTQKSLILELAMMKENHLAANAAKVGEKRKFLDAKKVNLTNCEKWQAELKSFLKDNNIKGDAIKSNLTQTWITAVKYPNRQDILKELKKYMLNLQKMQPTYMSEMNEWAVQEGFPKPSNAWSDFVEQVCIKLTNSITGAPGSESHFIKPTKCGGQFFKEK